MPVAFAGRETKPEEITASIPNIALPAEVVVSIA